MIYMPVIVTGIEFQPQLEDCTQQLLYNEHKADSFKRPYTSEPYTHTI